MSEAKELTDIYRFDVNKGKWVKKRDYEYVFSFKFAGNEFYLTHKNGWYFVCGCFDDKDSRLYMLYKQNEAIDGNLRYAPGEIVSEFRKKYLKNGINLEKITEFLLDPLNFCKKQ